MKFKTLFSPIVVGKVKVKNRIVMAPMGTNLQAADGSVTERLVDYFEVRARGGTGLIVSPFTAVTEDQRMTSLGVYSDRMIPGLNRLCESVKAYGTVFLLQIAHFGGKANKRITGRVPVAPSDISSELYEDVPRELTVGEIEQLINDFIEASRRAKSAGFDGVEVHGAHTYLIGQFISPHTNRRNDEYGGDFERRMKFPAKIVEGIKNICGDKFIVGFKFSAHEHLKNGIDQKLARRIATHMEKKGIDYLHISSTSSTMPQRLVKCNYPSVPPIYSKSGVLVELAENIKQNVDIPVIATGGITDPEDAEIILREKKADMVAIGRALIADPNWVNRARKEEDIKYCIRCNECHRREIFWKRELRCTVNPAAGEEERYEIRKTGSPKKIVVVGSGPAGMEAALVAAERGHRVILYEEKEQLGGKMIIASIPHFKREVGKLLQYYRKKIMQSNIKVKLAQKASADTLVRENPDVIILAVGADPVIPNVPGIKKENTLTVIDFFEYEDKMDIGDNIIILGAGLVGSETGWYLSLQGKSVKLVDILDLEQALDQEHPTNRSILIKGLEKEGVEILDRRSPKRVEADRIILEKEDGVEESYPMDKIIIATGFKSRIHIKKDLERSLLRCDIYEIGDCVKPRKFYNAINEGAHIARQI